MSPHLRLYHRENPLHWNVAKYVLFPTVIRLGASEAYGNGSKVH